MPPRGQKTAAPGRLIGYARVSTEDQGTDPQLDELRAAGCATVLEEHASGADRSRRVLARLLRDIAAGETLVVVRQAPCPAPTSASPHSPRGRSPSIVQIGARCNPAGAQPVSRSPRRGPTRFARLLC